MNKETIGTVISTHKQWWFKVKTKAINVGDSSAVYPYVIKAKYNVDGEIYVASKWIKAGLPVPSVGSFVTICYKENKPKKAKIL